MSRPITPDLKRQSKTYRQALGAVVTKLRTGKNLSQRVFAAKTGYSVGYMNQIESGKRNLSLEMIQALAEVFGLRASQLLAKAERKHAKR
jgi:transcriptional regulator with XRE-family HTH domain